MNYFGSRELGLIAYPCTFAEPVVIVFPIYVISNLTRTVSLAFRRFGNMISHQIIAAVLLVILPLVVPAVLEVFGLFIGVIQAGFDCLSDQVRSDVGEDERTRLQACLGPDPRRPWAPRGGGRSLVVERLDRVEARGPAGRVVAEEDAH